MAKIVPILSIQSVVKQYASHRALDCLSFDVPQQSIFGLLGPNGAGKTSLIRIITQITAPDEGQILFNGEPLIRRHIEQMGYLPEERGLYKKMKVGEQLLYLAQLKGLKLAEAKLRIQTWSDRFEIRSWWQKNVEDLSKGMQQKVQFIATVIHEPSLIILDEPFTGFDPINTQVITEEILALQKKGSTIIFSTHRMETVEELCDHLVLINQSKKVVGGEKKAIKNEYKDDIFYIETTEVPQNLSNSFQILHQEQRDSLWKIKLKVATGTTNQLIQEIIAETTLVSFQEHIPSMNEIFISLVKESTSSHQNA